MKTRWENWQATFGEVTARYEAKRDWAEEYMRLNFSLCIQFLQQGLFFARVADWEGYDVVDSKLYGSLEEALEYVSDVDCEKFVDEQYPEFQKMI